MQYLKYITIAAEWIENNSFVQKMNLPITNGYILLFLVAILGIIFATSIISKIYNICHRIWTKGKIKEHQYVKKLKRQMLEKEQEEIAEKAITDASNSLMYERLFKQEQLKNETLLKLQALNNPINSDENPIPYKEEVKPEKVKEKKEIKIPEIKIPEIKIPNIKDKIKESLPVQEEKEEEIEEPIIDTPVSSGIINNEFNDGFNKDNIDIDNNLLIPDLIELPEEEVEEQEKKDEPLILLEAEEKEEEIEEDNTENQKDALSALMQSWASSANKSEKFKESIEEYNNRKEKNLESLDNFTDKKTTKIEDVKEQELTAKEKKELKRLEKEAEKVKKQALKLEEKESKKNK